MPISSVQTMFITVTLLLLLLKNESKQDACVYQQTTGQQGFTSTLKYIMFLFFHLSTLNSNIVCMFLQGFQMADLCFSANCTATFGSKLGSGKRNLTCPNCTVNLKKTKTKQPKQKNPKQINKKNYNIRTRFATRKSDQSLICAVRSHTH